MRLEGSIAAFSRIELVIVIFVLILLGSVGSRFYWQVATGQDSAVRFKFKAVGCGHGLIHKGERQPIAVCLHSVHRVGICCLGRIDLSFCESEVPQISSSSLDKKYDLLRCPADVGDRSRTYAMPQHDMSSANWPPGPENRTGVGLWWSCWQDGGNASLSYVLSHFERSTRRSARNDSRAGGHIAFDGACQFGKQHVFIQGRDN